MLVIFWSPPRTASYRLEELFLPQVSAHSCSSHLPHLRFPILRRCAIHAW